MKIDPSKWERAVSLSYLRSERVNKCRYCPGNATYRLAASVARGSVMYLCGYCVKQIPAELRPGAPDHDDADEHDDPGSMPTEHEHLMWANRGAEWLRR